MATLRIAATLAYPLVIYLGLRFLHPRSLALCIGALLLLRLLLSREIRSMEFRRLALLAAPVALILGLAALFQNGRYFLFVKLSMFTQRKCNILKKTANMKNEREQ